MKTKTKKLLSLLCAIVMLGNVFLLTACNNNVNPPVDDETVTDAPDQDIPEVTSSEDADADVTDSSDDVPEADVTTSDTEATENSEIEVTTKKDDSKVNNLPYATSMKIVADMIHDNPGCADYVSVYTSPEVFIERGVDSKVFDLNDAAQYGLLWPEYKIKGTNNSIFDDEETEWILEKRASLIEKYTEFKKAGIKVYFMMDMMVLPGNMSKTGLDYKTGGKIDIRKADTQQMITDMFEEMFEVFVDENGNSLIDGIFVRTGETYTGSKYNLPLHEGNNPLDVYKADISDSNEANIACHTEFVNLLREELCVKYGKDLIYRTWSFGAFHNDKNTYLAVSDKIEPHKNLYFSIKYVAGDFFRNVSFNQCLNAGKHQQVVEVQSAREYEGKGAYPNYIGNGVIHGFKEYEWSMSADKNKSLSDIINVKNSVVVGIWTWSRGGGWDGPYINGNGEERSDNDPYVGDYGKPGLGHEWGDELWADINSYVVQKWAQDTTKTDKELALEYATDVLGMSDKDAASFYELLLLSSDAVLLGRSTNTPGVSFNQFFTRDDVLDNLSDWGGGKFVDGIINEIASESFEGNAILKEKQESIKIWEQMLKIVEGFDDSVEKKEYMWVTTKYGYYLYSLYCNVLTTGAYAKQVESGNFENKDKIKGLIEEYDRLWEEWEALYNEYEDCPTLFHRDNFRAGDGANRGSFDGVMDRYRQTYAPETIPAPEEEEPKEPEVDAVLDKILYENHFDTKAEDDLSTWTLRNANANKPSAKIVDGVLVVDQPGSVGSTNWYQKNFTATSGTIHVTFDIKVADVGDNPAFFIVRGSNGANIVQFDLRNSSIGVDTGTPMALTEAVANKWYNIVITIDTKTQKWSMYVNGVAVETGYAFREASNDVACIQIAPYGGATQTMYIDNIVVSTN